MKNIILKMKARVAIAALALVVFAGCDKYEHEFSDRLDNLEDRVTTLEEATATLKARLDAGSLIKSVTPITEVPGGWRIEFSGGSPSTIDILNGEDVSNPSPTTLQIEVRPGTGGTATVWYDAGEGWTDTGTNIVGPKGDKGDQGSQGTPGADGVSPLVRVKDNGNGTVTIQYNTTAGYPPSGWISAGDPIALNSNPDDKEAIYSIVENQATGTITITLNDSDVPEERTVFDFAMASGAARIELVGFNDKAVITEGLTEQIRFRVNPSNAWVPTGASLTDPGNAMSKWSLDQTATRETRASYVTAPTDFELVNIEKDGEKDGQYVATIKCLAYNSDITDYAMALVLNTGTAEAPALVSSPTFVLGVALNTNIKTRYTATDLKPGDYYYSDGTWSDGGLRWIYTDGTGAGAGNVAPTSDKIVVGIVFWTGDPTKADHNNGTAFTDFGDPTLRAEHPACTHGLVVALQDASTAQWQHTVSDVRAWMDDNSSYENIVTDIDPADALNKLRGYNNTKAIREYNTFVGNDSPNLILPVRAIDNWTESNSAPANSSGWYLPSEKELSLLCGQDMNDIYENNSGGMGMRDIVDTSMEKVAGATAISETYYWSGSMRTLDSAWRVNFANGSTSNMMKGTMHNVRPVLAF